MRVIAWHSLIGPHVDPKKLPRSIEKFMPLQTEVEPKGVNKAAFLAEFAKYKEEVKRKQDGK